MDDPEVDYESFFNDAPDKLEFILGMHDPEADHESLNDEFDKLGVELIVESLPLSLDTISNVNDAESADTQLGNYIPEETDKLNILNPDLDPQPFNYTTQLPFTDIDYLLHETWDLDTMPTPIKCSPSATLNSSGSTDQSPGFSSAYSTSPPSINYSPPEQLLPPSLGPTPKPTPTHDSSSRKKRQQRRRAKAKVGDRPCDKKRADRKNHKRFHCEFCSHKAQDERDRKRHYRTNHPEKAAEMGIDMGRFPCKYCSRDFARGDHAKRHMKTQHGAK